MDEGIKNKEIDKKMDKQMHSGIINKQIDELISGKLMNGWMNTFYKHTKINNIKYFERFVFRYSTQ